MTFWSVFTFLAAILPIIVIVEVIILARLKHDPSFLIFLFPMTYTSVFYILYLISVHIWKFIPAREFQLTVRILIVLYIVSLGIFLGSRLLAHRFIKQRELEFIEEIKNGRDN